MARFEKAGILAADEGRCRGSTCRTAGRARLFSPFGSGSHTIRLKREQTPKGYYHSDFAEASTSAFPPNQTATTPQPLSQNKNLQFSNTRQNALLRLRKPHFSTERTRMVLWRMETRLTGTIEDLRSIGSDSNCASADLIADLSRRGNLSASRRRNPHSGTCVEADRFRSPADPRPRRGTARGSGAPASDQRHARFSPSAIEPAWQN